ncbi:hypothetical protein CTKZ_32010 [Cellulomonas algicola]|uniref:Uncharacterized protein n=1 Tax=Cellulomonas algicola TaxID=2071633 RepID=A0A401V3Y4_9CELL|nr:hypothetical protein CTKZ_32010 [Cellulomonas algicola]
MQHAEARHETGDEQLQHGDPHRYGTQHLLDIGAQVTGHDWHPGDLVLVRSPPVRVTGGDRDARGPGRGPVPVSPVR